MIALLLWAAVVLVGIELTRRWLLQRTAPPPPSEPFAGICYPVGTASIVERRPSEPRATVICMHGYCENTRYFTQAYSAPDLQLILVASSGYYTGLRGVSTVQAEWARAPEAQPGSIEYDAMVLNQALEHLPCSDQIRVHGHSRGGAVVLEAAELRPDLFQGVEVILEAPILPQATLLQTIPALFYWVFPLLLPLWRLVPIPSWTLARWGSLRDPRKRELITCLPLNAKQGATLVANLKSLVLWMRERKLDLYKNLDHGAILIPEDDQVLDADSMLCSANNAGSRIRVLQIRGASHFILLDRPEAFPPLTTSQPGPLADLEQGASNAPSAYGES